MRRAGGPRRSLIISVPTGIAVAVVVGGWFGAGLGGVVGYSCYRVLARQPSRAHLAEQRRIRADLPFGTDLLGATLRAGAAPDAAAECVARAMSGPLSERLGRVARALRLGANAAEAWAYLGDSEGAQRVARAATRSQHSGAALAGALQRVADDLRADLLTAADAAARRAGVLIVLPLGLCFLPAFVLAGLVPVLIAILGDVLSGGA